MGFASKVYTFVIGSTLLINLFFIKIKLAAPLIQDYLEDFVHQVVLAQVRLNAKMENAGTFEMIFFILIRFLKYFIT